jgi:hypothetical protein
MKLSTSASLLLAFCLIYVPGPGAQVVFDEFAFFNYSISPENLEVGDGVTLTVKPGDVSVAGELKLGEDAKIIFDMKGAGEDEKNSQRSFGVVVRASRWRQRPAFPLRRARQLLSLSVRRWKDRQHQSGERSHHLRPVTAGL